VSYTKANADNMNTYVRNFFGKGRGSDNKRYDAPPVAGENLKEGQAAKRNANQVLATGIRNTIHTIRAAGKGWTAAAMGEMIVKQQLRGGNCAEMSWLCCHAFTKNKLNIWLAVINDPGDHQFCILSQVKPKYTSISDMKYMKGDQWIIDPWANIVCHPGEFPTKLTEKFQRWTARGKRIGIPNADKNGYVWTAATDATYSQNILTSGLKITSGG